MTPGTWHLTPALLCVVCVSVVNLPAQQVEHQHGLDPKLCLEYVAWLPQEMRVEWVMSDGGRDDKGRCVRENVKMRRYAVDFKRAVMTYDGESRPIEIEEAVDVRRAFHNMVTHYAEGSVAWWDKGGGKTEPSSKFKVQSSKPAE